MENDLAPAPNWQKAVPRWKFPPSEEVKERYFGQNFWKMYRSHFNAAVIGHPRYADLTLHIILGQLINIRNMRIKVDENEIDLRVSGIYWKPSGSGGGRGYNFCAMIEKEIGGQFQHMTEVNDGAIIGTIRQVKRLDPILKKEVMVDEKIYGWLYPEHGINILAHNEASMLFDRKLINDYSKKVMHFFQIALNPMGTVDNLIVKKLTFGEPLQYHPVASLFLISYPPDDILRYIIKTGFAPRCVIVNNEFSIEERKDHMRELTNRIGKRTKKYGTIEDIVQVLKHVNKFYKGKPTLNFTREARVALSQIVDEIYAPLFKMKLDSSKTLVDFTSRWIEHIWKCAFHHACTRLSNKVERQDVAHARAFIMPLWKNLTLFVEDTFQVPRDAKTRWMRHVQYMIEVYNSILEKNPEWKSDGYVPRTFMKKMLSDKKTGWNVSRDTAGRRMSRAEKEGMLAREYKGVKPWIKWIYTPKWLD